jgi:ElaB/YqjD/DUF883 family membrane-anchored ribosome-binding protein
VTSGERRVNRDWREPVSEAAPSVSPIGFITRRFWLRNRSRGVAFSGRVAYLTVKLKTGARTMATTKAREDIKNDLKTLKEDLKVGAREETARLREKAGAAEARIREKASETGAQLRARSEELRHQARGYYEDARVRGREYYDDAAERLDEAQRYLTERVQERPVQSTAIALGVGLVLGLLLAGRRR